MPTNAWYLLIVAAAIVVVLAIVKGRGLRFKLGEREAELSAKETQPGVALLNDATLVGVNAKDVTGETIAGKSF
ncbi:MAG: hypothetical protein JOZ69_06490, partial [Myxococcales bacterium]|nr:hypothetical protein [Myxococcales bacterium]